MCDPHKSFFTKCYNLYWNESRNTFEICAQTDHIKNKAATET